MKLVSWFSAGVSSAMATWIVRKELSEVIYCHIDDQHEDTMRFVKDTEALLGIPIKILQSPYKDVNTVIRTFKFVNGPFGARCTDVLKKRVRKEWEHSQTEPLTYVWGLDADEGNRAERIVKTMSDHKHIFPLIERGITKDEAHAMADRLGLNRPLMYDMGYNNNNCIGCIKGGMGYWNKIRKDFPEVFAARAKVEREIGRSCLKDCFLDELDPTRGNKTDMIFSDCGIMCMVALDEGK